MQPTSFLGTAGAIALASFIAMLGLGMMVPALPALTKGLPDIAHGAVISTFGIARLLVALPSGLVLNRIGIRLTAAIGLVLLVAGSLIGSVDIGFAGLIVSIALQGAGTSIFSTAAMTALVLAAGPDRRGTALSWFQGALLLSFSSGPVIGGLVVGAFGDRSPFLVEALLSAATLPILLLLPSRAPGAARLASTGVRWTPGLAGGSIMAFAGFLARAAVTWVTVPAIATAALSLTPQRFGLIIGVGTALNLAILPINAQLIDRWSATRVLWLSSTAVLAGIAAMWFAPSEVTLWIGVALVMIGTGAALPAAGAVALEGVSRESTGAAMGTYRMAGDIGIAVGPVLVSGATTLIGSGVIDGFLVTAAIVIMATAAFGVSRSAVPAPARVG